MSYFLLGLEPRRKTFVKTETQQVLLFWFFFFPPSLSSIPSLGHGLRRRSDEAGIICSEWRKDFDSFFSENADVYPLKSRAASGDYFEVSVLTGPTFNDLETWFWVRLTIYFSFTSTSPDPPSYSASSIPAYAGPRCCARATPGRNSFCLKTCDDLETSSLTVVRIYPCNNCSVQVLSKTCRMFLTMAWPFVCF